MLGRHVGSIPGACVFNIFVFISISGLLFLLKTQLILLLGVVVASQLNQFLSLFDLPKRFRFERIFMLEKETSCS